MAGSPVAGAAAPCRGDPRNCELLTAADGHHAERCRQAGISGTEAITNAMAVGLVIDVWRNGPVEDMHCGPRGPDDAVMFAESTALHDAAVAALSQQNRAFGLLDFEKHLLDRTRPWAGTGGRTLKDLGYGFLGAYARHVMGRTNVLLGLSDHTCVADPLQALLVNTAVMFGRYHKGMPGWPVVVERIGVLLADPDHPAWRGNGRGARALREMPGETPASRQLTAVLLTAPHTLSLPVLEWLSHHLLHCAGPPYGPFSWRNESHQAEQDEYLPGR